MPNAELKWYKLDTAANLFPSVSDADNPNVFRMSVCLNHDILPGTLEAAAEKAIDAFPSFKVRLKKGLFWYYLEPNSMPVTVSEEKTPPCAFFSPGEHDGYLFSVSYYKNRINLEAFHALCDGSGALAFFSSLLYHYLSLVYPEYFEKTLPPAISEGLAVNLEEDSFRKYSRKTKGARTSSPKAFRISGAKLLPEEIKVITADMPLKDMLALVKSKGASLTSYLVSLYTLSIYQSDINAARRHPVKINIPVNLRKHFPSESTRNFFACIGTDYSFKNGSSDFDSILKQISAQMTERINAETLSSKIYSNVGLAGNIAVRSIPLLLKSPILKLAAAIGEGSFTSSLSNLGAVPFPDNMTPFIDRFILLLPLTEQQPVKCTASSYQETLSISFTMRVDKPSIPEYFIKYLVSQGIDITIETNRSGK